MFRVRYKAVLALQVFVTVEGSTIVRVNCANRVSVPVAYVFTTSILEGVSNVRMETEMTTTVGT
jgi:hypothetical protein